VTLRVTGFFVGALLVGAALAATIVAPVE